MEERRGTRKKQPSAVSDIKGDLNERKLALQRSRAAHIGNFTKVYNEISLIIESGGAREDTCFFEGTGEF